MLLSLVFQKTLEITKKNYLSNSQISFLVSKKLKLVDFFIEYNHILKWNKHHFKFVFYKQEQKEQFSFSQKIINVKN